MTYRGILRALEAAGAEVEVINHCDLWRDGTDFDHNFRNYMSAVDPSVAERYFHAVRGAYRVLGERTNAWLTPNVNLLVKKLRSS